MKLKDIEPFVRYANRAVITSTSADAGRGVKTVDNRLFYVLDGQGSIAVGDSDYDVCRHSLLIVPAGVGYTIYPRDRLVLWIINFDMTLDHSSHRRSFHPFSENYPGSLERVFIEDTDLLSRELVLEEGEHLEKRLRRIISNFPDNGAFRDEILSADMRSVIIDSVRLKLTSCRDSERLSPLVRSVIRYLKDELCSPIDSGSISRRFHFTSVYINRVFKRETGVSVHRYLIRLRINAARELIQDGVCSPTEAAELVGFEDYAHFSKTFKAVVGSPPSSLRPTPKGDK